jgi:heme/copper-type cytochrome/quinol oxidase subunit 2
VRWARNLALTGLALMGLVAIGTAISPGLAEVVSAVFATVFTLAVLAPTALVAWRLRAAFAARRQLREMASVEAPWAVGPEPDVPTLAQLRGTA